MKLCFTYNSYLPYMGGSVKWFMKTAADRTSPGRIYRHFSGWKFSRYKGAWKGSCGTLIGGIRMKMIDLQKELAGNSYPGRGIVIGKSADGQKAVAAYFIMGRSENSRNRIFVEDGEGIRTQAFDPSKLTDPSLII